MDIFDIPDDYKPQKPLTDAEMEDITNYLKNHPLFIKEMPADISSNVELTALNNLLEDQDKDVMANNLCNQGNARLKEKPQSPYFMREAYNKYTEAIQVGCDSKAINAKLHSNRAAINLKLKNYGKVIEDCKKCISFDQNYTKGYYRYAKALIGLQKYEECIKLIGGRPQPQLKQLLKQVQALLQKEQQKKEKKIQVQYKKSESIEEYCKKKGWKLSKPTQQLPQGVHLKMIDNQLSIPLMIVYPQFSQVDLIAETHPANKIKEHLQQLFAVALPWDAKHEYTLDRVEVYIQVEQGVMMKVPRQVTISELAARVIIKGAIQLTIVSKGNVFYEQFLKKNKII